jgi:hypothetical protein
MLEQYEYIQCGLKTYCINMYYGNVLMEEHTALHFPRFKNWDGMQRLVTGMRYDQDVMDWKLHTLKDMRWNDNDQCPIKHRS